MDDLYKYKYKPCNIVIYDRKEDILLKEISLIAYNKDTKRVVALGNEAEQLLGNCDDNIVIISPLKNGFIANFSEAQSMFKYFINKAYKSKLFTRPKVIVCTPPEPTEVEEKAYEEVILMSGGKEVYITQELMDTIIPGVKDDYNIIIGILIWVENINYTYK